MTYQRKTKPAPWLSAFPEQAAKLRGPERKPKQIARRTETERERMARYVPMARQFLREHSNCVVFLNLRSESVHHIFGRQGDLLFWQPGWLPVSIKGHQWIDAHREEARKRGWLCEKGLWNRPGKVIPQ